MKKKNIKKMIYIFDNLLNKHLFTISNFTRENITIIKQSNKIKWHLHNASNAQKQMHDVADAFMCDHCKSPILRNLRDTIESNLDIARDALDYWDFQNTGLFFSIRNERSSWYSCFGSSI